MTEPDIDARLQALLAPPEEFPDEIFTARVTRAVLAEARMRSVRSAAWRRFGLELLTSGAVVAAFALLGRLAPDNLLAPSSPALPGVLLLGLWAATTLRPASLGR